MKVIEKAFLFVGLAIVLGAGTLCWAIFWHLLCGETPHRAIIFGFGGLGIFGLVGWGIKAAYDGTNPR